MYFECGFVLNVALLSSAAHQFYTLFILASGLDSYNVFLNIYHMIQNLENFINT